MMVGVWYPYAIVFIRTIDDKLVDPKLQAVEKTPFPWRGFSLGGT
jgi:hypothetical protein